jgi:hypothetical protein
MGKVASQTAQAFSWERMSARVLEFYEETLAGRASGNHHSDTKTQGFGTHGASNVEHRAQEEQ